MATGESDHGHHHRAASEHHHGGDSHDHHHHGGAHGEHRRHRNFGNSDDLARYIADLEGPSRAEWQKPDEVVRALALQPGQIVCDVGAGPGYFSLRLAKAVGDRGHVWALEVDPHIIQVLRDRIQSAGVRNVTPVLALPDAALLPPRSCDLVLMVETYHHLPDGPRCLSRLRHLLRDGGRLVNIDLHKRPLPFGPKVDHKVAREEFLADAELAELELVQEHEFLRDLYFLVLRAR
jgi:ubiquinone/menaquinone biosynthesis C-methylase UbiE